MTEYTFQVTVYTDTAEHARMVMVERLGYEEDYKDEHGTPFEYHIQYPLYPYMIDGEKTM